MAGGLDEAVAESNAHIVADCFAESFLVAGANEFLESLAVHHCRADGQTDQYADRDARTTKISDRDADAGNGTEREAVDAGSLSRLISQGADTTSCWDQRRRLLPTGGTNSELRQ